MSEFIQPPRLHEEITSAQEVGKFLLGIIQTDFDVEQMVAGYRDVLGRHAVLSSPRADGSTLRSVSLTHRPKAETPVYDGNNTQYDPKTNQKLFLERDFSVFNPDFMDTVFYDIYQRMPFRVGRMRLNLLPPLTVFTMHRDSAPRAHIALTTNPDCFLNSGDGQAHHIPTDGNVYVFDTKLPHTAFNASREDRIHLTMALADEE